MRRFTGTVMLLLMIMQKVNTICSLCYLNGIYGVRQDADEAAYWLGQAANSDILEAQVILAQLYEKKGDLQDARYWYQRGLDSKKYMINETSDDELQDLKNECKLALERCK